MKDSLLVFVFVFPLFIQLATNGVKDYREKKQ